jgi:signal transduction histidine kinase
MHFSSRSPLFCYGIGVMLPAAALGIRLALMPLVGPGAPYTLYLVATLAATQYGGLGPGILAIILGGIGAFLTVPISPGGIMLYTLAALPILVVVHRARRVSEDRRQLAEERRQLLDRLSLAQKVGRIGTWELNLKTGAAAASAEWFEVHGLPPGDRLPAETEFAALLHPDDRGRTAAAWREALLGTAVFDAQYRVIWPDGTTHWLYAKSASIGPDLLGVTVDLTAIKRMEERLRQAQKLESIGVLAGGVAHDFNNLLTAILGNASLAVDAGDAERREHIQAIVTASERAADLTRQLLAYAGKGRFLVEQIALSTLVCDTAELLRVSVPKTIQVRLDLHHPVPPIEADRAQIQQVLMNLILNAAEAIGDAAGLIQVCAGTETLAASRRTLFGDELAAGRYVWLEVTDSGPGLDDAVRARIFDPFFTTKFTGRGLGLAAVAGIVRSCGGTVEVRSAPGQGASFRVLFPASGETDPVPPPALPPHPRESGAATVLVVDDESYVRDFMQAALGRLGYRVLTAENGRQALDQIESRSDIRLVLLDLVMPFMPGRETLEGIRRLAPDLRVILTSGWSQEEAQRLSARYPGVDFLQKPYTAERLADTVAAALNA